MLPVSIQDSPEPKPVQGITKEDLEELNNFYRKRPSCGPLTRKKLAYFRSNPKFSLEATVALRKWYLKSIQLAAIQQAEGVSIRSLRKALEILGYPHE